MRKYSLIIWTILLFCLALPTYAASFNMTSSTGQVSSNGTFTINVGGDCIGRVDLSVSNGSLSTNSVWVEQGYVSVTVTAGSSGSVTVTATPAVGFSDSDANIYNPGSRSVTVGIASNNGSSSSSSNQKPNTQTPGIQKSGDNNLSSLSVNGGQLLPDFSSAQREYTLNLPANTKSLTINAVASNNKARIEGIGQRDLVPGNNNIEIIVTAENGDKKTYIIKVYVDDTPQVYLNYKENKIGIIQNFSGVSIPEGFNKIEHSINDKSISMFVKEKINVIYGVNEKNEKQFYLFNKEKNEIISKFIPILSGSRYVYVLDTMPSFDNLSLHNITLNEKEIACYQFKDKKNNYCLLNAINDKGETIQYLYESSENTIQLYPEFLLKTESKKDAGNIIVYILSGLLILTIGIIVLLILKLKKRGSNEKVKSVK